MKRAVLIVNPFATRVTEEAIAAVERALMRVAYVRTMRTEGPRHAVALARDAGDADAVIVFSGDGGFNEALNGIERSDLPLGFVPGGGTSVLPRALGLPRDPVEAAEQLADALDANRFRLISTGRVNDRRFAFGAGIGVDAEVVRRIDDRGRSPDGTRPGDLAFVSTFARLLVEHVCAPALRPPRQAGADAGSRGLRTRRVPVRRERERLLVPQGDRDQGNAGGRVRRGARLPRAGVSDAAHAAATSLRPREGPASTQCAAWSRPRPDRGEDGPSPAASGRRGGPRRRDQRGLRSRARLDLRALLTFVPGARRIVRCGLFRLRPQA